MIVMLNTHLIQLGVGWVRYLTWGWLGALPFSRAGTMCRQAADVAVWHWWLYMSIASSLTDLLQGEPVIQHER